MVLCKFQKFLLVIHANCVAKYQRSSNFDIMLNFVLLRHPINVCVKYQRSVNFEEHSTKFKFHINEIMNFASLRLESICAVKYEIIG